MKLPTRPYNFYAGIDPGFGGAIALMNQAGTTVKVWPMPVTHKEKDRQREIDLAGLREIFRYLKRMPDVAVGIEFPTTRPGEGAERSERFGRGKGYLHAFAFLFDLDHFLILPQLWKGRLGLPGKEKDPTSKAAAAMFAAFYSERVDLVHGPRGGVLDGPLDALLIAHFLRVQHGSGLTSIVQKFGHDSTEVLAFVLSGGGAAGRHRRGQLPRV